MSDEILRVDPQDIRPGSLDRAVEALRSGGLVAFPTETVYGIAVASDRPDAIERLYRLKGRSERKPMAYHVGSVEAFRRLVPDPPAMARRLVERYWPGPLTLVVPGIDGPDIGIRHPANAVAIALLSEIEPPAFATSANPSGGADCTDAESVLRVFGSDLDVIVDGGPTELAEPSTVVRVDGAGFRILREGFIDAAAIHDALARQVLLVCSGNTCRSPMAAALFERAVREALGLDPDRPLEETGLRIGSAGTMAFPGGPPSQGAVRALASMNIDLRGHETRPVTLERIREADWIFTMTEEQRRAVLSVAPEAATRVALLDPSGHGTLDPYGGSDDVYRRTAEEIRRSVAVRVREVLTELDADRHSGGPAEAS